MRVEISNLTKHVCYITKPFQFYHNTLTAKNRMGTTGNEESCKKKKKKGHSILHLANQGTKYEKIKNVILQSENFF